jgi:hypothetical protein
MSGPMSSSVSEIATVAGLAAGEMKGDWQSAKISLQMNLG